MPRYRNKNSGTIASLADGHAVVLGSEWEELGKAKADPVPPVARRRKRATSTDDD